MEKNNIGELLRPRGPDTGKCSPRDDRGVGQALEAMVIGATVALAIGFAVASQAPPPPSATGSADDLEQEAWDSIAALDEMEYPDASYGNSTLSYLLAQAAAGDSKPLADSLDAMMPTGSKFQLYLHNGHDRIPLHENTTSPGQTVGVSYPVEPRWQNHYGRTDLRLYNANASDVTMGHTLIPIFNSNHVRDQGETVKAQAHGELEPWGAIFDEIPTLVYSIADVNTTHRETSYTTFVQGGDSHEYPSASIYMQCSRGESLAPCYGSDLTENGMDGYGPKSRGLGENGEILRTKIGFVVENNGPGALPSGTELRLSFPVGIEIDANAESPGDGFDTDSISLEGVAPQPQSLTVELENDLEANEKAVLDVWIERTDDRYAYKKVDASLADGAASESQLLLLVEDKPSGYTGGDARVLMVSTPRPAGSGDQAHGRWGLVLTTPVGTTNVTDVSLELTQEDGHFETARFPEDFNPTYPASDVTEGSWDADPDKVTWTKDVHRSPAYEFIELQVDITTDGAPIPASPVFPAAHPETKFQGYHPPPHYIQQDPGIWWTEHPPREGPEGDLPGYGAGAADPTFEEPVPSATIPNFLNYRNQDLEGTTQYRVADLDASNPDGFDPHYAIQDSVHASWVETIPQRATPGESVDLVIESRDLALYLSQNVGLANLDMETKVYAPWGIPELIPAERYDHSVAGAAVHDPLDVLKAKLTEEGEDLAVASTDGNVYGVDGRTGKVITGASFPLPASGVETGVAKPTLLLGTQQGEIAVGTSSHLNEWFLLNGDLEEEWSAPKPGGYAETKALNDGADWTGDGVSEFVAGNKIADPWHQLVVHDGETGDVMDGWPPQSPLFAEDLIDVGFANLGTDAEEGVWVAPEADDNWRIKTFHADGSPSWAFWGPPFLGVDRADGMEIGTGPNERPYQGLVGPNENGWVYGFNSSRALPEASTATYGLQPSKDVAFSNSIEGYLLRSPSEMLATDDGGTTFEAGGSVDGAILNAVDTPEDEEFTGSGHVSWWVGEAGAIYRSEDRLENIEDVGATSDIDLDGDNVAVDVRKIHELWDDSTETEGLELETTGDLTLIDFYDVHAISDEEAVFLGKGRDDTDLGEKAFILETQDGGETLQGIEIDCEAYEFGCQPHAIASSDEKAWTVGSSGLALVEHTNADATRVKAASSSGIQPNGNLDLTLEAEDAVAIDEVAVSFDFEQELEDDWLRSVLIHQEDGIYDLWNKSDLDTENYIEDGIHSDKGATSGTRLLIQPYTENVSENEDARILDGTETLKVGPFRTDLQPDELDPDAYFTLDEYDSFFPMTFTVDITYDDGSWNRFIVESSSGGHVEILDYTPRHWILPEAAGYETPSCFGEPDISCSANTGLDIHSDQAGDWIAVTTSGGNEDQAPIVRLTPGQDVFEPVFDPRLNEKPLNDVSIDPEDPQHWLTVGDGLLQARSQDGGANWTILPPALGHTPDAELEAPLRAVDSNPNVPIAVGGDAYDLRWWHGGHAEEGHLETNAVWEGQDGEQAESVTFYPDNLHISDRAGATLTVSIYDPSQPEGDEWVPIYERPEGWVHTYTFDEPQDEMRLRFDLATDDAWSALSPQVRGALWLQVSLYDSAETETVPLNLEDANQLRLDESESLHHGSPGYLRLEPIQNPWVWKLGNYHFGDWAEFDDATHGAEPTAMELSQDGEHLYVGTGPIHAGIGTDTVAYDNSLYKINVTTGLPEDAWSPPLYFHEPILDITLGEDVLYVVTGPLDSLKKRTIHAYSHDGAPLDGTVSFDGEVEHLELAAYRAGFEGSEDAHEDLAAISKTAGAGDGFVIAYKAPSLEEAWWENPSLEGIFEVTYDVPRGALYGAHIVVTELSWNVTDSKGNELLQTARIHNSFDVTPLGREITMSPTYNLEVVAWYPDW